VAAIGDLRWPWLIGHPSTGHYVEGLTTREELHALIDRVPDDDIDAVVQSLRPFIEQKIRATHPAFIGMGRSGHSDTSARVDEILRETGFGE
jgi:hypothetical protein